MENETPHISINGKFVGPRENRVAFWIEEQRGPRGKIVKFRAANKVRIEAGRFPRWHDGVLYIRGVMSDRDGTPMFATSQEYARILIAVAEFNAHHAKLAEAAAKATAKAEAENVPRRIFAVLDLVGSQTTETECRNCDGYKYSRTIYVGGIRCEPFMVRLNCDSGMIMRCAACLAAEKLHADMRSILLPHPNGKANQ